MNKYAILIGIAGGTGSGKTSIAKAIASDFGKTYPISPWKNDLSLILTIRML